MKQPVGRVKWVIGVDEAGRGPLAGPLAVGLVCMKIAEYAKYKKSKESIPCGIDSKKLSARARERWFAKIKSDCDKKLLQYHVIFCSNAKLDTAGLTKSISSCIKTGLLKFKINIKNCLVLLDGGLIAPSEYKQKTIIKGDEKEKIISLASICAKVLRDHHMINLSRKFPEYGFEKHKGYGTKLHYAMIQKFGASAIHRKSFLKNLHLEARPPKKP